MSAIFGLAIMGLIIYGIKELIRVEFFTYPRYYILFDAFLCIPENLTDDDPRFLRYRAKCIKRNRKFHPGTDYSGSIGDEVTRNYIKHHNCDAIDRRETIGKYVLIVAIGCLIGYILSLTGCGRVTQDEPSEIVSEQTVDTTTDDMPVASSDTAPPSESDKTESTPSHEQESSLGSFRASKKDHSDADINSVIKYDDSHVIYNLNDTVVAGIVSGDAVAMAGEYGIYVSILNSDSVLVSVYNNGSEYVSVSQVSAELTTADFETYENKDSYTITGYESCGDGLSLITVDFSTGKSLTCGIMKNGDKLWAANTDTAKVASQIVQARLDFMELMADAGYDETNTITTNGIYYPIMPVNSSETTDVAYWVNKSKEIVLEEAWVDEHKAYALYDYMINNLAYDHWVLDQGDHARWAIYESYDGSYYTSSTHIGVCEDFANIFAIMCRAQNIPAIVSSSNTHAWVYIYLKNLGRWVSIDPTISIQWGCYSKDTTDWTASGLDKSKGLIHVSDSVDVRIGNTADIEYQTTGF